MKLLCAVGGHDVAPDLVYNSGYYFTSCRRCRQPLIRTARSEWQTVPRGHRIVWAPGPRSHSLEADYAGVLPIVQPEEAALPALRSPFVSWSRSLVRLRRPDRIDGRATRVAAAEEEAGDYRYPRLLLAAVVLGAGLKMLLNLAAGR